MIRRPLHYLFLTLAFTSLSACSDSSRQAADTQQRSAAAPAAVPHSDDPAHLIREAETIHARARELGHGWNVTVSYISAATQALHAGDAQAARKHATRAFEAARASLVQAETERDAWQARYHRLLGLPGE